MRSVATMELSVVTELSLWKSMLTFLNSYDYRDTLFPRPTRRIISPTRFPILPVPYIHDVKFPVPSLRNGDSETGTA